jgi:hypothetical protein
MGSKFDGAQASYFQINTKFGKDISSGCGVLEVAIHEYCIFISWHLLARNMEKVSFWHDLFNHDFWAKGF